MEIPCSEIEIEIPFHVRVYKDGRIEKLSGTDTVPCGVDPATGVHSKDAVISPETPLAVRLYIPNSTTKKHPLVVFFHGGGFILESAQSPTYHNFLNLVSSESDVVVASVDYRTAPEHYVPACYEDSWEAIKWVALHASGNGPEAWLNEYADFENVFFAGDSAGGNIAHQMAIKVGSEEGSAELNPKNLTSSLDINHTGLILLHPYFWGEDPIGDEILEHPGKSLVSDVWFFACPGTSGLDDPYFNPDKDPNVSKIRCSRVLVCVAELDILKHRGLFYKDVLAKNGWKGDIQVYEDNEVNHVFFLDDPSHQTTTLLRNRISAFINQIKE